jgi:hypothetical protein
VQIVYQIMHRSAGLLNTDEQLLAAGRSAAAGYCSWPEFPSLSSPI